MAKSKFTVKRIEDMELAVRDRYANWYCPTYTKDRDYQLEISILQRAIYYLELGMTPAQVRKAKNKEEK